MISVDSIQRDRLLSGDDPSHPREPMNSWVGQMDARIRGRQSGISYVVAGGIPPGLCTDSAPQELVTCHDKAP